MQLSIVLFAAFFTKVVVCLPFVDVISPDLYPNHILVKSPGFQDKSSVGKASQCDWAAYQTCFQQFISDAGLGSSNTANSTYLIESINALLAAGATQGGVAGASSALFKLCRAQQKLFGTCLGQDQATQCVSAIEYIRQGITSNNGFSYQMLFTRLNFQCGVGFTSYIAHALEVANTPVAQAATLQNCTDTFINNLFNSANDPYCGVMEIYTECVGKIYATAAQGSVDFGWTVCEAYRLANIITLPQCTDSQWACKLKNLQ